MEINMPDNESDPDWAAFLAFIFYLIPQEKDNI
jgi:hypothetical protein